MKFIKIKNYIINCNNICYIDNIHKVDFNLWVFNIIFVGHKDPIKIYDDSELRLTELRNNILKQLTDECK